jgi:hypothetical protein
VIGRDDTTKEALVYSTENAPTDVGVVSQADYYQPLITISR